MNDNLDGSGEVLLDMDDEDCEIQFDIGGTFYLRESPSWYAQTVYPGGYDPAEHPVMRVTWFGAARYCDWLSMQAGLPRAYAHAGNWLCNGGDPYGAEGYRLPTDAEWEYAAQWNDERVYPWGNNAPDCTRANFFPNPYCVYWTSPVGSYPAAPEALGLADIVGNTWEWCNDWWVCDLGTSPATDPVGPVSGSTRALRGRSWGSNAGYLRCAGYHRAQPRASWNYNGGLGLRVARTCGFPANAVGADDHGWLRLGPCGPNPFTCLVCISYQDTGSHGVTPLTLNVHDAAGVGIRTLVAGIVPAGRHTVTWTGTNESGQPVGTGIYFIRLE